MTDPLNPPSLEQLEYQRKQAELRSARETPSVYANRVVARTWEGITKIVFGEQLLATDQTVWSASVSMTTADAIALADLIYQQVEEERLAPSDFSAGDGGGQS